VNKPAAAGSHWLVEVARAAELPGAERLTLEPQIGLADAWVAVARGCGISEEDLVRHVATRYKVGIADLATANQLAQALVPEKAARRYLVFPLRENDRQLIVATANPSDLDAEQALGFVSGRTPVFEVAPPAALQEALDQRYAPDRLMENLLDRVGAEFEDVEVLEESGPEQVAAKEVETTPVVKLTNLILRDAVRAGVSDIHLEPGRDGALVRFRVDGVLRTQMQLPMPALNRVVSRIKIIGKLDIADRMRPQDGRARVQVQGRAFDLRISTVPTRDAEKAVIRILDPRSTRRLDDLGVAAPELARLRRLLTYRDGLVVVTGPTGSGKTTLLYAALRELATGEVNIMTVEDPVEYELPGLTQIQVETKRGVTFASALRSILRQDPDVVLVGEIRDLETAEIAVQASLTGHLVLATLHANDAVAAVARFTDLGLDRAKLATTLRGSVAQRLMRRACASCAVPADGAPGPEEAKLATRYGVTSKIRTVGCAKCAQTGYRGRIPVVEVLAGSPGIETLIGNGAPAADLQRAAVAGGMRTLRDVALARAAQGETTLQEVERVLGGGAEEDKPVPAQSRVLLVDDDAVNRGLARGILEKNGFAVTEAGDGLTALEVLATDPGYALMVLDLDMPRLGGLETLERLRSAVQTAALPVIVLTGSTNESSEVEAMDKGADDYVRKPLEPARFVARVKAALRRAGG